MGEDFLSGFYGRREIRRPIWSSLFKKILTDQARIQIGYDPAPGRAEMTTRLDKPLELDGHDMQVLVEIPKPCIRGGG